jgi:hypothetical protein
MVVDPLYFCQVNGLNACETYIIKYVCRHHQKGGAQDIDKVIHTAEILKEIEYPDAKEKTKWNQNLKMTEDEWNEATGTTTPKDEDGWEPWLGPLDRLDVGSAMSEVRAASPPPPSSPQLVLPLELESPWTPSLEYPQHGPWYEDREYWLKTHENCTGHIDTRKLSREEPP